MGASPVMYIYRTMSEEEYNITTSRGKLHFIRKYKYFTPNLEFITNRVLDGKFNNSNYVPSRYTRLVSFLIDDSDNIYFTKCGREWVLDIRNIQHIHWRKVNEL